MPSAINPDFQPHKSLESDVKGYLESKGFLLDELTYHTHCHEEFRRRLQTLYTPSALCIRGRADRLAIHRSLELSIQWEAKTHADSKYHDCCIEAIPFAHHLNALSLGVDCLYSYRDLKDAGFWVSSRPPIREIKLPERWDNRPHLVLWFHGIFTKFYPNVPVRRCRSGGSGDPFLVIDEKIVQSLTSWRSLIDNMVADGRHTIPTSAMPTKNGQSSFFEEMT